MGIELVWQPPTPTSELVGTGPFPPGNIIGFRALIFKFGYSSKVICLCLVSIGFAHFVFLSVF